MSLHGGMKTEVRARIYWTKVSTRLSYWPRLDGPWQGTSGALEQSSAAHSHRRDHCRTMSGIAPALRAQLGDLVSESIEGMFNAVPVGVVALLNDPSILSS